MGRRKNAAPLSARISRGLERIDAFNRSGVEETAEQIRILSETCSGVYTREEEMEEEDLFEEENIPVRRVCGTVLIC